MAPVRSSSFLTALLLCAGLVWPGAPAAARDADDSPAARIAAGGRALAAGDLEKAAEAFGAARDLDPDQALAWLGLADVAERRGQLLEALEWARAGLERAMDRGPALGQVARLQIRLGAPREALESLAELRRIRPADPAGYLTAAAVLRDIDRVDEAVALLRTAASGPAASAEVSGQLGLLLLGQGQVEAAGGVAEAALERWPERAELELVMGLALLADAERRPEAATWLERALEHGAPGEGKIQLALGEAKLDGCSEDAVAHFRRAVALLPELPEAHYKLGLGLRACGDGEGARTALLRVRELSGAVDDADHRRRQVGAALNDAQRAAADGDIAGALRQLGALEKESPRDDRIFTLRGKLLFSSGRLDEALRSVRRAQALMPSRVEGHYLEGLFLSQSGDLEGARAALGRALAIDPERREALKLQAAVVAESGDLETAATLFRRSLDIQSEAVVHLAYARVLAALGRTAESEAQMELYRGYGEPP
ncbi:MAG: tetratricopeptide repeat protein [Acidobacteriota bacterium]